MNKEIIRYADKINYKTKDGNKYIESSKEEFIVILNNSKSIYELTETENGLLKLYFDIDVTNEKIDLFDISKSIKIEEDGERIINEALKTLCDIEPKICIAVSHSGSFKDWKSNKISSKYSVRYFISNIVDKKENIKNFVKDLNLYIKQCKEEISFTEFDESIYSKNRLMRCVNSTKPEEERPLILKKGSLEESVITNYYDENVIELKYNEKNINIYDEEDNKTIDLYNETKSVISDITDYTLAHNNNSNIIDLDNFKEKIYGLSKKRSDEYEQWSHVVWGIANISRDNKWTSTIRNEIIYNFSKKSEKYDEYKVDDFIDNHLRDDKSGINVGSIIYWYNEDNNIQQNLENKSEIKLDYILNNRLRDYDIAKYIKNKIGNIYVCSDIKNNTWYCFEDPIWKEEIEGLTISNKISEDIPKECEERIKCLQNKYSDIEFIKDLVEERKEEMKIGIKKEIMKINIFIDKCRNNSSKKSIINELKKLCYKDKFVSSLDKNPYILGCKNGIIDLKEGIFRKGKPEDMCSMSVGYNYISLEEIINNKNLLIKYNELIKFMESLFVIEGIRNYIYEHLASVLIGICKEQDFNYYMGKGSNGKTKLVKLMSMVMGDYYGTAPTSLLCSKKVDLGGCSSEIALLKGKRYVVMQEPTKGEVINEGVMKELTGENDLFCNPKHKTPFYFTPMFKLVICANFTLDIKSNDHGTWRRIKVVDFLSQFKNNADKNEIFEFEKNIDLEDNFNEWKYILLAILTEKAFLLKGRMNENEYIKNATNKYRDEQDKIGLYIKNNIDFISNEKISKEMLGEDFKNWIDLNFRIRIGINNLLERLENEFYTTFDNLIIYGVKIKNINESNNIKSEEELFLEEFHKYFEIIKNEEDKNKYFIKSVRLSEWAKLKNLKFYTSKSINKLLLDKLNYDTKQNLEKKSIENNKIWIYKNIKEK